jgi:hypothetical protein
LVKSVPCQASPHPPPGILRQQGRPIIALVAHGSAIPTSFPLVAAENSESKRIVSWLWQVGQDAGSCWRDMGRITSKRLSQDLHLNS